MSLVILLLVLSVSVALSGKVSDVGVNSDLTLNRVAFGSCNHHDDPQPLWDAILEYKPDLWIWLGDIVYGDELILPFVRRPSPIPVVKEKYDFQKNIPKYKQLYKSTPVIGVFDDHDYNENNSGKRYKDKDKTKKLLLEFLDEPIYSPRWNRSGVYGSWVYGKNNKKVMVILLDTRYNRDDPNTNGDMLGEEQWLWLENIIANSDADVHIVGSSIQFIPHDKPISEKWIYFPQSRTRLLGLLSKLSNPIVISGDVHYGEILAIPPCDKQSKQSIHDTPLLYEITSSGMTHCCKSQMPFGICEVALKLIKSVYNVGYYKLFNFGSLDFNWDEENPSVEISIRSENGTKMLSQIIKLHPKNIKSQALRNVEYCEQEHILATITAENWLRLISSSFLFSVVLLILFAWYRRRGNQPGEDEGASRARVKAIPRKNKSEKDS